MAVHVGIIDQDPIRLVTPLLDDRTISRHIIFIGDDSQFEMYERLSSVLAERDITSEFYQIPNIVNTSVIKQSILGLAKQLKEKNLEVKLNASCGLRHRLLSVYEVFRTFHWPIFVVEPNSDKMCWLYPEGATDAQVQDHITIGDYLTDFWCPVVNLLITIYHRNSIKNSMNWAKNGRAMHWN